MSRVVVIGSINMDIVATGERLPRPGENVIGTSVDFLPGGKGANQAVAATRAGATVQLCGALGNDESAHVLESFLTTEGISSRIINRVEGPSGTAVITVDKAGQNIITVIPGANNSVDQTLVNDARLGPGDFLLLQNEIPDATIDYALHTAHIAGATIIYNPAPYRPITAVRLDLVDYLVVNEHEFAGILKHPDTSADPDHVRAELAKATSNFPNVIVTLGSGGICARINKKTITIPGHQVKAVDATGAGDCLCGTFAAALAAEMPAAEALAFANAAAALSVGKPGAGPSMPYRAEIEAFLKQAAS